MTETGGIEGGFAVVLAAAGSGSRFDSGAGSGRKQFLELGGRPLLFYSLDVFASLDEVRAICIVVPGGELEATGELAAAWSGESAHARGDDLALSFVAGGDSRQESVRLGIEAVGDACEWILVHDAVRPLVDAGDVGALIDAVREYGAAALGYPATDSIKREADGFCEQGIDRSHVWCVQTPQGASAENFRTAYSRRPEGEEHTDELGLLEAAGISAKLVEGSRENIKVTLPGDEDLAAFFLSQRQRRGRDG